MKIILTQNISFLFTDILVNITSNGSAFCTPPALITTDCKLNVESFPFDEKICTMKFGRYSKL